MERFIGAVVQMDCIPGDRAANLARAERFIRQAASRGAELIVLPELFDTGYRVEEKDDLLAEPLPGAVSRWMQDMAAQYGAFLAAAVMERAPDGICDTALLVGAGGILSAHRKMHLWGGESARFRRGDTLCAAELPWAKAGLLICYEIGFPEQARVLARQGASLLLYPSAFGRARAYAWDIASRSRALENGAYVLAANRCGAERDTDFGGLSRIVAPDTTVLAGAGADGEAVLCAEIDLAAVDKQRDAIPYLRDLDDRLCSHAF